LPLFERKTKNSVFKIFVFLRISSTFFLVALHFITTTTTTTKTVTPFFEPGDLYTKFGPFLNDELYLILMFSNLEIVELEKFFKY